MILFFASVYLVASLQEWLFHKYLMHRNSLSLFKSLYLNHILHHKTTMEDYSIRNGETEYICVDIYGTEDILQIAFVFSFNTGFFYFVFGKTVSLFIISTTVAMMLLVNILVWNTIHPYVHGMDPALVCHPPGLAKKYLSEKSNPIVRFLVENHKRHHDNKNTNFNIVFPGADYLLGTSYKSKTE